MQRRKSNTIVSLWYRAPEIILGSEDYLLGVDMWSMGCIFAEFFTLKPIFQAKNEEDALDKIFSTLGYPTATHSAHLFDLKKLKDFPKLQHYPIKPLAESFPSMAKYPLALDLLGKILALDPRDRITAREALKHEFFIPISRKEEIMMSTSYKSQLTKM
jgi:serine/threonine protein kinase